MGSQPLEEWLEAQQLPSGDDNLPDDLDAALAQVMEEDAASDLRRAAELIDHYEEEASNEHAPIEFDFKVITSGLIVLALEAFPVVTRFFGSENEFPSGSFAVPAVAVMVLWAWYDRSERGRRIHEAFKMQTYLNRTHFYRRGGARYCARWGDGYGGTVHTPD